MVITRMRYFQLGVRQEIKESIVGRVAIFIKDVYILRLDQLAYIHPSGGGGVPLDDNLMPGNKLPEQLEPLKLGEVEDLRHIDFHREVVRARQYEAVVSFEAVGWPK
jgi:hypothetical protein